MVALRIGISSLVDKADEDFEVAYLLNVINFIAVHVYLRC